MAIALVDIQIYTLKDIEKRQAKHKDLIGVKILNCKTVSFIDI